ncbi:CoA-binding protein [Prosthecodimorpha staleyi]|uniref:CoA-binding protein n=1 Tax=Prosthecodimorpha staleyi TaxID=2840188 RepID=A0A947CZK7_9HYPH|nr:CoA-binding protein [Prosthecodimorpha staleyi]MBT9288025.1 CoA-binding protein [Prosthecodimorpha staleyi]
MNHDAYDDAYIRDILESVRSIAVVGASNNNVRPSYFVQKYLISKGYEVWPINPGLAGKDILGRPVHASLAELNQPVDMVDIFRAGEHAVPIVEEAIRIGAKVIWMQLSVRNDEAAALAEAAGLRVVMNRCPKIEYGRLCGEISWIGVNSRTISSKKPARSGGFQHLGLRRPPGVV